MTPRRQRLRSFLFGPSSDIWVTLLRFGLGLQIILYSWSLRNDWEVLFGTTTHGPINRVLVEAVLSAQSHYTPRLGWLIACGQLVGLGEGSSLTLIWFALVIAGLFLMLGLFCRCSALGAWLLYLSSVKSGILFSYGVDNFTTIGLFYLVIAPLPDRLALDWRLWELREGSAERLGFQRRVLQVHLCIIYFFAGISKSLGAEWWNGDSVWRALTRAPFDVIPAERLLHFAFLLPAAGISVCLLETAYPILIWPRRTRPFWLTGILFMHLSIGLTMGLYLFALIMMVLNLSAFGPEYFALLKKKPPVSALSATLPKPG